MGDSEVAAAGDIKLAPPERWRHDLGREEGQTRASVECGAREAGRRGGSAERTQTVEGAGRAEPAPVCLPPSHSKKQAGHRNAGTGVRGLDPQLLGWGGRGQCVLEPVASPEIHRRPSPQDAGPGCSPLLALWRFLGWGLGEGPGDLGGIHCSLHRAWDFHSPAGRGSLPSVLYVKASLSLERAI